MRIELSENGHSVAWKPISELTVSVSEMEDGPFGKGYFIICTKKNDKLADLLKRFDSTKELEFYFYKNILYIYAESEPLVHIVSMFDECLNKFIEQIKKERKIIIAILGENQVENLFSNDIII